MLSITGKLVQNGSIIAYKISADGNYCAIVTKEKAIQLGIEDAEIAEYLDLDETEVVRINHDFYGVVSKASSFFEEFAYEPVSYFGSHKLYYGYLFEDQFIMPMNNDLAIERLLREEKGVLND